ncbi:MAG: rod shape-determining protein MreC [Actinomycetota bacterium]|nr:rod shape-determining protein MreC [Acidimicrobiales bacterium]MEC7898510.1 rod shape-determining protein MreC [Actinomycetota bacterium]
MPKRSSDRPRVVLLVLMAAALTLLTAQFRDFLPVDEFQQGFRDVISPVRRVVDKATDPFQRVWNGVFEYDEVSEENERLQLEIARMRGAELRDEADRELLERLLGEVDIDYLELETVVARIIGVPGGNYNSHVVEINKGSDDGLQEGAGVITKAGLVGYLYEVDRSSSFVRLATHPDFRVGVRLINSQDEGLARGNGSPGILILDAGISIDSEVSIGEVVVTSGGRSIFPQDIPVGRVYDPDTQADYARSIEIDLSASLENLSFLNVITRTSENSNK